MDMKKIAIIACVLFFAVALSARAESPQVTLVVGGNAPKLELFAADELTAQWKQLFSAEVSRARAIPAGKKYVVVLGSPATNPAFAAVMEGKWPQPSDQAHIVKTVQHQGNDLLVIGGGSPVATLWAVYETGYRFGIRS